MFPLYGKHMRSGQLWHVTGDMFVTDAAGVNCDNYSVALDLCHVAAAGTAVPTLASSRRLAA